MSVNYIVRFLSTPLAGPALGWFPYKVPWTSQPPAGVPISVEWKNKVSAFYAPRMERNVGLAGGTWVGGSSYRAVDGRIGRDLVAASNEALLLTGTETGISPLKTGEDGFSVLIGCAIDSYPEAWASYWSHSHAATGATYALQQWNNGPDLLGYFDLSNEWAELTGDFQTGTATSSYLIIGDVGRGLQTGGIGDRRLFKNGVFQETAQEGSLTTQSDPSGSSDFSIFQKFGDTTLQVDGTVFWAIFLKVPLSDAEVKSLSDNPWQIFEPRTIMMPIS